MHEALFTLDAQAESYLKRSLRGFSPPNLGLAICLATQEHESIHNAHSIDLCGFGADQLSDCKQHTILGHHLWIRDAELGLLAGRELTVIQAGAPKKRPRLVIRGITEHEIRSALLGGR
jgi:hypothetical protein